MKRDITIETTLGDDVLLFHRMAATEQMSRLFTYDVELLTLKEDIKMPEIIGQPMTVKMLIGDDKYRYFNGIVSRFAYRGTEGGYQRYSATLRPWMWSLTRRSDCRIFQDQTVPDIIKAVLGDAGYSEIEDSSLKSDYRTWEYCVQYRETDFNFISRLMEQEGIYYFFDHDDGKHTLVLADSINAHGPFADFGELKFFPPGNDQSREESHVAHWEVTQEYQTNIFAHTDYDFTEPTKDLMAKAEIPRDHTRANSEIYDYPGEYTDGGDGDTYAKARIEEMQANYERCDGQGNTPGVAVGHLFTLANHPRADQGREYLVLACSHQLDVGEYETGGGSESHYSCNFHVMPSSEPYRAPRVTPKPAVQGPQTAIVVGPEGETVWCDEFGRVKVQFHWDREGQQDENSSCWMRVSQTSAGAQWGGMFLPHIGHEVIVEFLEGDPDRPIITGRIYNADNMPPRVLPDEKYRSVMRDHFGNELCFDGTPGEEHVMLRSPSHNSSMFLGKSKVELTSSDSVVVTLGDSNTRHLGNYQNTKIGDTFTTHHGTAFSQFFGTSTSFTIAAKQSVEIGTSASFFGGVSVSAALALKASYQAGMDVSLGAESYTKSVAKDITMDSNKTFKAVGGPSDESILRLSPTSATLTFGKGKDAAGSSAAWKALAFSVAAAAGAAGGAIYSSEKNKSSVQSTTFADMKMDGNACSAAEYAKFVAALKDSERESSNAWVATAVPVVAMVAAAGIALGLQAYAKGKAKSAVSNQALGVRSMVRANEKGVVIAAGSNLEAAEPHTVIKVPQDGLILMSAKEECTFEAKKLVTVYAEKNKTGFTGKCVEIGKAFKQKFFSAKAS